MDELNKSSDNNLDSLERPTTVVSPATPASSTNAPIDDPSQAALNDTAQTGAQPQQTGLKQGLFRRLIGLFNVYLLIFIILIVIAGVAGVVFYLKAQNENPTNTTVGSQSLSQATLDQLANSDVSVGEPQHTLNIQSNAIFTGSVLVRSNLQIAGALQVGSSLAINGIRVTGNSTFDDVQVTKSLAVTGNSSVQGQLNVQKNLNVNGGGTFLGALAAPSLTVGSLQLNGDLVVTHHLSAGGSTPGRSSGTALGNGGTTSVSGSDSAGSVTINTGGSPAIGCFITINFANKFNTTPHVIITPVGPSAAGLQYYINRSTSSFSICTATAAPSGATFGFDYIAFD